MLVNRTANSTARIWSVFSDNNGVITDADTHKITIYPANSNTPEVAETDMTRLGTGVYYYPYNATGKAGDYTSQFNFELSGTNYSNVDIVSVNTQSINGDLDKSAGTIARLYSNFINTSGEIADTGTMYLDIYPANSDTRVESDLVCTRLGTGVYYYPLGYGSYTNGNYTGIFTSLDGTNYSKSVLPFTIANGTADVGVVPSQIGTIAIVNQLTGSSLDIMWSQTTADDYSVYYATNPFNSFTLGTTTTEGTITLGGLQNQTEYYIYVIGNNSSGASLPSDIQSGLVYSDQFNYLKNNLEALQTRLKNNLTDFNDVQITDTLLFPARLPLINIFPDTDDEENMAIGLTGKMDKIYNIKIRIYDQYQNQTKGDALLKLTEYAGLVQAQLEAVKSYQPYWYLSDITSTEYGEATIEQKILKYIDINWTCVRRITRYQ